MLQNGDFPCIICLLTLSLGTVSRQQAPCGGDAALVSLSTLLQSFIISTACLAQVLWTSTGCPLSNLIHRQLFSSMVQHPGRLSRMRLYHLGVSASDLTARPCKAQVLRTVKNDGCLVGVSGLQSMDGGKLADGWLKLPEESVWNGSGRMEVGSLESGISGMDVEPPWRCSWL